MKQVYKASDDSEHATVKACQLRDALIRANLNLEDAVRKVQRCLAESAMTADGEYLDFTRSRNYYFIVHGFGRLPYIYEVYLFPSSIHVDMDRTDCPLTIREYKHGDRGRDGRYECYRVCELYANESKAKEALVKVAEKDLAEFTEEVQKLKMNAKGKR